MNLRNTISLVLLGVVLTGSTSPQSRAQSAADAPSIGSIVTQADSLVLVPLRSEAEIKADIKRVAALKEESEALRALVTTVQSTISVHVREQEGAIESAEMSLEQAEDAEVEADITAAEKKVEAAKTVLDLLELQQDLAKAAFEHSAAEVKFYAATLAVLEVEDLLAAERSKHLQTLEKTAEGEEKPLVTADIHTLEGKLLDALKLLSERRSEFTDTESNLTSARIDLFEKRAELMGLGQEEEDEEDAWD